MFDQLGGGGVDLAQSYTVCTACTVIIHQAKGHQKMRTSGPLVSFVAAAIAIEGLHKDCPGGVVAGHVNAPWALPPAASVVHTHSETATQRIVSTVRALETRTF